MTPLRRWLNRVAGAVFLALIAWMLWPLVSRPIALHGMCSQFKAGTSMQAVESSARSGGFKLAPGEKLVRIYDQRSLGKFYCGVHVELGLVKESSFHFNRDE